jgi:hypothetical protein
LISLSLFLSLSLALSPSLSPSLPHGSRIKWRKGGGVVVNVVAHKWGMNPQSSRRRVHTTTLPSLIVLSRGLCSRSLSPHACASARCENDFVGGDVVSSDYSRVTMTQTIVYTHTDILTHTLSHAPSRLQRACSLYRNSTIMVFSFQRCCVSFSGIPKAKTGKTKEQPFPISVRRSIPQPEASSDWDIDE